MLTSANNFQWRIYSFLRHNKLMMKSSNSGRQEIINTTFKGTVLVKNNVVDKNINISRVVLHCSYELLNMFGLTNS